MLAMDAFTDAVTGCDRWLHSLTEVLHAKRTNVKILQLATIQILFVERAFLNALPSSGRAHTPHFPIRLRFVCERLTPGQILPGLSSYACARL